MTVNSKFYCILGLKTVKYHFYHVSALTIYKKGRERAQSNVNICIFL